MTQQPDDQQNNGIIGRIQRLPQALRVLIFFGGSVAIVVGLFALTGFLYLQQITSSPRTDPVAMQETGITVREFATFDQAQAYPAALAITADGTLYTASYATGAVWQIAPDSTVTPLADSAPTFGSIAGLDVSADGTLYILDRRDPIEAQGATVYRQAADGSFTPLATFETEGDTAIQSANDITVDLNGNVYVSDLGNGNVWKIPAESDTPQVWWQPPAAQSGGAYATAGLAVNLATNALLITDTAANRIQQVPLDSDTPADDTQLLYQHTSDSEAPGFNGITANTSGEIFVTALATNRVAQLNPQTGDLTYLAGAFRGASDVAYDNGRNRLYVNNWDQRSLLPVQFLFLEFDIDPRLPFSVDVIEFTDAADDA